MAKGLRMSFEHITERKDGHDRVADRARDEVDTATSQKILEAHRAGSRGDLPAYRARDRRPEGLSEEARFTLVCIPLAFLFLVAYGPIIMRCLRWH